MINFNNAELIEKYGNWVKVQVAFHDFIFQRAVELCPAHFKEKSIQEISDGFVDGEEFYEESIKAIHKTFSTPEQAWSAFRKEA